jgi:hypothetical protein
MFHRFMGLSSWSATGSVTRPENGPVEGQAVGDDESDRDGSLFSTQTTEVIPRRPDFSTNLARLAQYSRRIEHYITQTRHLIHHLVANKKAIKVRIILKFTLEYTILLIVG